MRNYVISIMATLALVGTAFAGPKGDNQAFYAADASPAIWVVNTFNETVTCAVTNDSSTITVTVGSTATTIDASGTAVDTVAELESAIRAVLNSNSKKGLKIFRCAAAGTEAIDYELLIATTTIKPGSSGAIVLWDTSDVKHYRAYLPPREAISRGSVAVKSVYGDVKGTGGITMKAYTIKNADATQIDMREVVSPIYVKAEDNTTNVLDSIAPGIIDIAVDHQVGASVGYLFSADRATTGTTGGIGIRTEER